MPRDERTFITVHDGIDEHPKIEALSDPAFRLLISTWAWCSRNRTDGKVRAASWVRRGGSKARSDLLAAGLAEMQDCGDVLMHDYLEHQRSAQEIEDLKEKRRAAGSKGGKAKASATADAIPNAKHVAKQTASKPVAESESYTDTRNTLTALPSNDPHPIRARDEIFDAVVDVCGIDPTQLTTTGRGPINKAVKELREIGATPGQITLRARNYRRQYRDAALTPSALTKHWAVLGEGGPTEASKPRPPGWEFGMN